MTAMRQHERSVAQMISVIRQRFSPTDTLVVTTGGEIAPILGAYTLEAFCLGVDSVNKKLVPIDGWLL